MTSRTFDSHMVTALAILGTGLVLLVAGALIPRDSLTEMGAAVLATGMAYATGKAFVRTRDNGTKQD